MQFDPKSNLLSEETDGQYLLFETHGQSKLPIVIPNTSHFSSKQDYYGLLDELFNCDNPAAGEILILSPAVVEKVDNGWSLREPGFIEIKPAPAPIQKSHKQPDAVCLNCGTQSGPGHTYCKRCGSPLQSPRTSQITDTSRSPTEVTTEQTIVSEAERQAYVPPVVQVPAGPSYPWKPIFGAVAGLATLGIIIAVIAVLSANGNALEKRLDKAIIAGNLFTPAGENVHDLYLQLKSNGASEQKLRPYRERVLPLLTDGPQRMINEFMVPGSDEVPLNEWQDASRSLSWATELNPSDNRLRSRALYAQGRLAYLGKDENLAITIWTRAGEADTSWSLPINGIGLIYTARKNYETARRYYQSAIQREPNWAYPYNNIGTSYYLQRNYHDAKGFYQKAAELAPRWARPHSWLGDIAMKEKDYATAISEFTLALDSNATGTKNMDLEKIRKQLELAQQLSASGSL